MKIIHLADTHLGFRQYAGKLDAERGINQRECDVYAVWHRAIDIAIDRQPGLVIHAGDLFDSSRPTPIALTEALDGFRRLREAGIPVVVIAGNHSTARFRSAHGSVFQVLERFGIAAIWDGPRTVQVDGIAVHACPHEPDRDRLSENVANLKLDARADANVLLLHAGLEAVRNSYGEVNEVEIDPELLTQVEFDYIALGHLHRFQAPQINAIYPGSLERLDFNDLAGDKAVVEINLEAGAGSAGFLERIVVPTRPILDLVLDCRDLGPAEVLSAAEGVVGGCELKGSVVRLRLEGITRDAYQSLDFAAIGELFAPCLHHVLSVGREGLRSGMGSEGVTDLSFATWAQGRVPAGLDEDTVITLARRYLEDAAAEEAEAEE
jgi:DNA repair protein SbcD/Mre11